MNELAEKIQENCAWRILKYRDVKAYERGEAYQESEFAGNLLLNEGINELWALVSGTGATKFDNSNARLGVGDSSTAASASDTGLLATTNKLYKAMNSGYPTYGTGQKVVFRSTFDSSEAVFAWNEFTVANGLSDTAKNLNRKVSSQGTKPSDQIWELELTITLS